MSSFQREARRQVERGWRIIHNRPPFPAVFIYPAMKALTQPRKRERQRAGARLARTPLVLVLVLALVHGHTSLNTPGHVQ